MQKSRQMIGEKKTSEQHEDWLALTVKPSVYACAAVSWACPRTPFLHLCIKMNQQAC